jgi:hypothetical protein
MIHGVHGVEYQTLMTRIRWDMRLHWSKPVKEYIDHHRTSGRTSRQSMKCITVMVPAATTITILMVINEKQSAIEILPTKVQNHRHYHQDHTLQEPQHDRPQNQYQYQQHEQQQQRKHLVIRNVYNSFHNTPLR